MKARFPAGGGCVPRGWTVARALATCDRSGFRARAPRRAQPVNLAAPLIGSGLWPARDQGHRSTCNAFAVIAAEELSNWLADPKAPLRTLSEEYLYKAMRDQPLDDVPAADPEAVAESGTTFLSQAIGAMAESGLVLADPQTYDSRPHLPVNHVIATTPPTADVLPVSGQTFVHNIKASPDLHSGVDWVKPLATGRSVADLFLQQLVNKRPVVASFAILESPGDDSFTSSTAQMFGEVRYPVESFARELGAIAGHTVCIVGYQPGTPASPDGWFVFRNSYGTVRFALDAARNECPPTVPARGYGVISAADLELYCWEFLFRA